MSDAVAVITDIHANLPALQATLARIEELGIERAYCGGDLVGYGPHPSQTTYEFAASLGAAIPETRDPVRSLAEVRVRERYSPAGADDDAQDAAVIAWHRAASAMLTLLPGRILRFFTRLGR